jgi:hypothetical protein
VRSAIDSNEIQTLIAAAEGALRALPPKAHPQLCDLYVKRSAFATFAFKHPQNLQIICSFVASHPEPAYRVFNI